MTQEVIRIKRYFTLGSAQRLTRTIPQGLTDQQLQKYTVKVRDFLFYINGRDMARLVNGGYYGRVIDSSATGLVPVDPWLQSNLTYSLDEAIREKQQRIRS